MIALGIALAIFLVIGVPIAFAIGAAGVVGVLATNLNMVVVPTRMFTGIDSFLLLAAPFYILAGEVMARGGITERLVTLSMVITRNIPGGTAHSVVMATMMFSGVSGSSVGDAAAMGQIYIREMPKEGYTKNYTAAVVAAASMMGPIIPPSVSMIIYSFVARVSVVDLFIAGIIPGVMLGLSISFVIFLQGWGGRLPSPKFQVQKGDGWRLLIEGALILTLPILILRGATIDWFTMTEAGGIAVFYAGLLGVFVFRRLNLREVWQALGVTAQITGGVFLILAASTIVSYVLARAGIGSYVVEFAQIFGGNQIVFLLAVVALLMVVGMFLEPGAAVILLVPLLLPVVGDLGINPLQFGLVVITSLTLGLITPPVGVVLFVVGRIAKIDMWQVFAKVWPFLLAELGVVILLCLFPPIASWLPAMLRP